MAAWDRIEQGGAAGAAQLAALVLAAAIGSATAPRPCTDPTSEQGGDR